MASLIPMWTAPTSYEGKGGTDELYKIKDTSVPASSPSSPQGFDLAFHETALNTASTPEAKTAAAISLASQYEAHEAIKTKEALTFANQITGVDALEAKFQQDMELDRRAKYYDGTMSKITQETYARLNHAKGEALKAAELRLKTDPELAGLRTRTAMLTKGALTEASIMADRIRATEKDTGEQNKLDAEAAAILPDASKNFITSIVKEAAGWKPHQIVQWAKTQDADTKRLINNAGDMNFMLNETLSDKEQVRNKALTYLRERETGGDPKKAVVFEADMAEYKKLSNQSPEMTIAALPVDKKSKDDMLKTYQGELAAKSAIGAKEMSDYKKAAGTHYAAIALTQKKDHEASIISNWEEGDYATLSTDVNTKKLIDQTVARTMKPSDQITLPELLGTLAFVPVGDRGPMVSRLMEIAGKEADRRNQSVLWQGPSRERVQAAIMEAQTMKYMDSNNTPDSIAGYISSMLSSVGTGAMQVGGAATALTLSPGIALAAAGTTPIGEGFGTRAGKSFEEAMYGISGIPKPLTQEQQLIARNEAILHGTYKEPSRNLSYPGGQISPEARKTARLRKGEQ